MDGASTNVVLTNIGCYKGWTYKRRTDTNVGLV